MRRRRDGFVLMAALWLLVALSAVGLDAALRHRARAAAAANLIDETRLQAAATAGTEYARSRLSSAMLGRADQLRKDAARINRSQQSITYRLSNGQMQVTKRSTSSSPGSMNSMFNAADPGTDPWRDPSGLVPSELDWNGISISLVLHDPNATLNLNGAGLQSFQQFFSLGLRLDYALSEKLAASIMDWRDDDDLTQINGGEKDEYIHDGMPMLPANHAFSNVNELRYVRGMTDKIFEQAKPFLSVRSNGGVININAAPEEVILSIPGMDQAGATAILRARRSGIYPRNSTELRSLLPGSTIGGMTIAASGQRGGGFATGVIYTTSQVEVVGETFVPGNPVHAISDIIVDRAINGAAVTWRRIE